MATKVRDRDALFIVAACRKYKTLYGILQYSTDSSDFERKTMQYKLLQYYENYVVFRILAKELQNS